MESDRTINTRHGCPQHAMARPNLPKLRQTSWSCVCCLVSFFVSAGSLIQSSSTLPENTVELHPQSKVYILIFLGSHYNHMVLMCSLCMFRCMGGQISRRSLCRKSSGIVRKSVATWKWCIEEAVSISINQRYWLRAESSKISAESSLLQVWKLGVLILGFLRQNFGMGVWGSLIWRHPWSASVLVCVAPQW